MASASASRCHVSVQLSSARRSRRASMSSPTFYPTSAAGDALVQRHDVELPIHLEYVVCHDEGEWTVTLMERLIASYRCESDALRGAIEAARDAGIRGHRAEV